MAKQSIFEKVKQGMKESGGFIAKEIMENMEKFDISPIVSVKGKARSLKFADDNKLKDFIRIIEETKLSKTDFWFVQYEQNQHKKSLETVIIIAKKSGKLKEYKISLKSEITEFVTDLKNGFYN